MHTKSRFYIYQISFSYYPHPQIVPEMTHLTGKALYLWVSLLIVEMFMWISTNGEFYGVEILTAERHQAECIAEEKLSFNFEICDTLS